MMVSDTIGRWYPQLQIIKSLNANNSKEFISENFDGVYYGKSSGYLAINIAYIMGCNPIYLLGFDLEGKHFHDGYGKRMNERLEQDHKIIGKELIVGITEIQARGTTICSMSPMSILNEYIPFASVRDIIWS